MAKSKKVVAPLITVAPVVTEVASTATKLTKRNATPITAVLVATDKAPKSRAAHVKAAWDAVIAALPATATELAKLEPLADKGCVSPQAFLSYMIRRGFLTPKA
jgi:hypothetical protein